MVAAYEYDALNRRVRTTQRPGSPGEAVTRHVYAGGAQVLEEYSVAPNDDEALLRWFAHGESFPDPLLMVDVSPLGDHADATPEYLWYLKDALGSTGALANLAGEIVEGYVYTPYGETTILDELHRPREVVAREAFYHDANFDGAIDGFDWVDLQTHLAAARLSQSDDEVNGCVPPLQPSPPLTEANPTRFHPPGGGNPRVNPEASLRWLRETSGGTGARVREGSPRPRVSELE